MSRLLDGPRYTRWTWIIATLLIALLVVLWLIGRGPGGAAACCGIPAIHASTAVIPPAPATSAAKPAVTATTPATRLPGALALRFDAGKFSIEGSVPDQATRERLLKAASVAYGEGNVVDRLSVDASKTLSRCADKFDGLLVALKSAATIGVECEGDRIALVGTAPNEAAKGAREQWAREFFGTQIANRIDVVAPPAPVAKAEDVRCGDRIAAAVTFATGSMRIDGGGRRLLDAIARCLNDGSYEIAGYTDDVGNTEANMKLSQSRANAVRTYLIAKGVAADRLRAVGHGAADPIADNTSPEGRAKNRRIEFTKK